MFPTSSFLQIPPRDGHPCFRLYPSHYRADSGLAPVGNVRRQAHIIKGGQPLNTVRLLCQSNNAAFKHIYPKCFLRKTERASLASTKILSAACSCSASLIAASVFAVSIIPSYVSMPITTKSPSFVNILCETTLFLQGQRAFNCQYPSLKKNVHFCRTACGSICSNMIIP